MVFDLRAVAHGPNVFHHSRLLFWRFRLLVDLQLLIRLEVTSLVLGEILHTFDKRRSFVAC